MDDIITQSLNAEQHLTDYINTYKSNSFERLDVLNNHNELAELYQHFAPRDYLVCNDDIYALNSESNIWELQHKEGQLSFHITNFVKDILDRIKAVVIPTLPEEGLTAKLNKKIHSIKHNIGTGGFLAQVVKMVVAKLNDPTLNDILDADTSVLAFKDGYLYDFKTKQMRPTRANDFITLSCSMNSPYMDDPNKSAVADMTAVLLSIFNTAELMNYWLDVISQSLITNKYSKMYIHTGEGGNGKSLLFNMLRTMLGGYYIQAEGEFLSTVFASGATNPVLYQSRGKRIIAVGEPSSSKNGYGKTAGFNISFVKLLTGSDAISCRTLHKTNRQWINRATPHACCNDIPATDKLDNATKRRFDSIIPYENKFTNNPVPNTNERQVDYDLGDTLLLPENKEALMYMLLSRTRIFKTFAIPDSVKAKSKEYMTDNNPVFEWFGEWVCPATSGSRGLRNTEAWEHFKAVSKQKNQVESRKDFLKFMRAIDGVRYDPSHAVYLKLQIRSAPLSGEHTSETEETK